MLRPAGSGRSRAADRNPDKSDIRPASGRFLFERIGAASLAQAGSALCRLGGREADPYTLVIEGDPRRPEPVQKGSPPGSPRDDPETERPTMTMQIDHPPYAPALDIAADAEMRHVSPVVIVALNLEFTVAAIVLASVTGAGLLASMILGWIGGGVLTLAMLFWLFGSNDAADVAPHNRAAAPGKKGHDETPDRRRAALLAEWEADRAAEMQADVKASARAAAAPAGTILRRLTRAFGPCRASTMASGSTHLG